MVNDDAGSTIHHETRRPKTAAERQRAYRDRQRQKHQILQTSAAPEALSSDLSLPSAAEPQFASTVAVTPVIPSASLVTSLNRAVTLPFPATVTHVTESHCHVTLRPSLSSYGLTAAALALAGVGITMNGWFARTLGSTDLAGYLFLAIGIASDLVALAVPPAACQLWQDRRRATAAAAWAVWSITFVFAVTSGIGFASVNIADVTLTRASRVTPAVTIAQEALRDALTARNRECTGGVGRFCREREQTVTDRQRALDAALNSVEHAADPQTDATAKIVAWLTAGAAKPGPDGFAMLRLLLLALLPQVGGILLMVGRAR